MSVDLPHYSRYIDTEIVEWEGSNNIGLYQVQENLRNIKVEDLINVRITTGFAGRPDLISQKYYNTPYYSWVIVIHNAPLNPIGWPRQGDLISMPDPRIITNIINNTQ